MTRNIIILLIGLMMCVAGKVMSQEQKGMAMAKSDTSAMSQGGMSCPMMQGGDKDMKGMKDKMKKMGGGMDMEKCMMMGCMMQKQMIATSDGGVIVMVGNKLQKYDKDLKLIKEVEMKMDMEAMKKMMEGMKK